MKEFQETQEKFEAILKNNSNIKKYNKVWDSKEWNKSTDPCRSVFCVVLE